MNFKFKTKFYVNAYTLDENYYEDLKNIFYQLFNILLNIFTEQHVFKYCIYDILMYLNVCNYLNVCKHHNILQNIMH